MSRPTQLKVGLPRKNSQMNVQQLMLSYPTRFRQEKRGQLKGLFYFEISGQGADKFSIRLDASGCSLLPGKAGTPDCVVRTDRVTLLQIENEQLTLERAISDRRLTTSDANKFKTFLQLFRPLLLKQII